MERSTGGGAFTAVATLGRNATTYTSTGLAGSTRYAYRVRAVAGSILSGASNTVSVTTPAAVPAVTIQISESHMARKIWLIELLS